MTRQRTDPVLATTEILLTAEVSVRIHGTDLYSAVKLLRACNNAVQCLTLRSVSPSGAISMSWFSWRHNVLSSEFEVLDRLFGLPISLSQ